MTTTHETERDTVRLDMTTEEATVLFHAIAIACPGKVAERSGLHCDFTVRTQDELLKVLKPFVKDYREAEPVRELASDQNERYLD